MLLTKYEEEEKEEDEGLTLNILKDTHIYSRQINTLQQDLSYVPMPRFIEEEFIARDYIDDYISGTAYIPYTRYTSL